MKDYTIEEIAAKVDEIFKQSDESWDELDIRVVKRKDGAVSISVEKMYEAPGLDFAKLSALAEFFETKNINDDDRFGGGGCETCDYGSSYGFELVVRPDGEGK